MRTRPGLWLLGLGASSLVAALLAPACSRAASRETTADAGTRDVTASSSGGETGTPGGDGNTGSSSGSSGGDEGDSPAPCQSASIVPARLQACASTSCCQALASCGGEPACGELAACVVACATPDAGESTATCADQCVASASSNGFTEYRTALACLADECSVGDAGLPGSCASPFFTSPPGLQACVTASCCSAWSTCFQDPGCLALSACVHSCAGTTGSQCLAMCSADAGDAGDAGDGGLTSQQAFAAAEQCLEQQCPTAADAGGDL
jgi:hypothetical protein